MDKQIINIASLNRGIQKASSKEKSVSVEEGELKILQANGYAEIIRYQKLVNSFIEEVMKLAIFQKVLDDIMAQQIRYFLIDELLESFIKPIFQGDKPPFLGEEEFNGLREDMYKKLIEKYITNKNNNKVF